jgi:hypothetical protein
MNKKGRQGAHLRTVNGVPSELKWSPGKTNLSGFRSEAVHCLEEELDVLIDVLGNSGDDSDISFILEEIDPLLPDHLNLRSTANSQRYASIEEKRREEKCSVISF